MELERELSRAIAGEVRFDRGSRGLYAHDASNYRQVPIGVVIPREIDDVLATLRICRAHGVPILGRGGGTSLAGQCVNEAIVLDFSKYMNRIVEIDVDRRRVRVQPGVVLDDLKAALAEHGLTYGPDPSTHSHCTLGGMIGNNSCGVHSVMAEFFGPGARTSDHVIELEVVTYDGVQLRVGATSEHELALRCREPGRAGEIYRGLVALRDRHADVIRAKFAPVPRRVSGYSLDELLPERGFHLARALTGTESTCVTILEATLEVYPMRPARALVVLGYPSVFEAADHVPQIREFKPVGLEAIDDRLVQDMKKTGMHEDDIGMLPDGKGWLLVELGGETREEAEAQAHELMARVKGPTKKLYDDREEEHRMWKVRESALGATAYIPGAPDAYEGWEDAAVPPAQLGAYLRDFRALLDRYHLDTTLYGHFGQGCVHCRINFDFTDPSGIEQYKRFTAEAADLVVKHGGSLSGEHGDGQSRGELLRKQYGDDMIAAFRAFKQIWDPDDKMNPGKVVDGNKRTQNLKLAIYHPEPIATTYHPGQDHGDFRHAALRCVGIGNCRQKQGGTMCPSYMVTHEEKHSTRGRARLLYEMVQGDVIRDGWQSEDVKDALDLCLSCKGCKGDCPVHVDMAQYKSEFLSHYYKHNRRPVHAYAFGWIHRWARLASWMPSIANAFAPVLAKLAGIATERPMPRFAKRPFTRSFTEIGDGPEVLLWPDTFNNHFFPETLHSAAVVLADAGYRVIIPRAHVCCGRALYDYGMLDLAKKLWRHTFDVLPRGVPIVGLEPSCVAAFHDEMPDLMPDAPDLEVFTLAGFLARREYQPPQLPGHALLHGHCHHKSVLDFDAERELLANMGLQLELPDAGCCGLAGSFGFQRDHYDISMAIGERVLLPAVRETDALLIADGFSCREQIRHGAGRHAYHAAEIIAATLEARTWLQSTASTSGYAGFPQSVPSPTAPRPGMPRRS
jgi:FAD/FMN-containing dehydrogenase/Fe-S oxidoreductase